MFLSKLEKLKRKWKRREREREIIDNVTTDMEIRQWLKMERKKRMKFWSTERKGKNWKKDKQKLKKIKKNKESKERER